MSAQTALTTALVLLDEGITAHVAALVAARAQASDTALIESATATITALTEVLAKSATTQALTVAPTAETSQSAFGPTVDASIAAALANAPK